MRKYLILSTLLMLNFFGNISAQKNLALNKPAYASGEATPNWGHTTLQANDGDLSTRWQGTEAQGEGLDNGLFADTSWWFVDLGQNYNIEGVRIFWEAAFAVGYTIDISTDSINWKTVYTQKNGTGNEEFLIFTPTMGRYVRLYTTLGNMTWYPSMWEFEVYEHGNITFNNFTLNFDRSLPSFAGFKPSFGNVYTNKIESVVLNDSILKISGNSSLATTEIWDTLSVDFEKDYTRNFSSSPFIYLNYKSDADFLIKTNIKTANGAIVSSETDTVFASKDLADHWIRLEQSPDKLDTILHINIDIRLLGNHSVYIEKFEMGKSVPAVKLQFIKPAKGQHFGTNEPIETRIDAISGKIQFLLENKVIKEIQGNPYQVTIPGLKTGYYKLVARHFDDKNALIDTTYTYFAVGPKNGGTQYRDSATERLYLSLKTTAANGYPMFGMQMPTTRGFVEGNMNLSYNTSDCKDITGSHPAYHEADFANYGGKEFRNYELFSLKEAVKRGAVVGFCWHLGGLHSGGIYVNGDLAAPDAKLVSEIISDTNRLTNPALDWYLTQYDKMAIPIFKEMGCPVVFRPLHEMTGSWFWWGSLNKPADVAKLFAITVDYIRSKGVRNVLYCWAPNLETNFGFYPGDDYVDILGYDGYQIGVASYAGIAKVQTDLTTLTDYAATHDKVTAFTETGLDQTNGYPDKYPDWWTKKILTPILSNKKTKRLAWIETWCNSGTYWIPYKGCNTESCKKAIADFIDFYKNPATIFENDIPDMYGYSNDSKSAFIYPDSLVLTEGQTMKIFGGTKANWALNEKKVWNVASSAIGKVNTDGLVSALTEGTTKIELTVNDTIKTSIKLVVKKDPNSDVKEKIQGNAIKIYPNPSDNNGFNVELFANANNSIVDLIDTKGQIVSQIQTSDNHVFINTTNISGGVYFVKVKSGATVETKKVFVVK